MFCVLDPPGEGLPFPLPLSQASFPCVLPPSLFQNVRFLGGSFFSSFFYRFSSRIELFLDSLLRLNFIHFAALLGVGFSIILFPVMASVFRWLTTSKVSIPLRTSFKNQENHTILKMFVFVSPSDPISSLILA